MMNTALPAHEVELFLRAVPLGTGTLTSSSQHNDDHNVSKSVLNSTLTPSFAWATASPPHWICASMPTPAFVTGVGTQSRPDCNQRVTRYRVSYSLNGIDWEWVPGCFIGNVRANTTEVVRRDFPHPVHASYIKLHAEAWEEHPSIRWEVYGVPVGLH